jgi:Domain of unknown function (DUF4326)
MYFYHDNKKICALKVYKYIDEITKNKKLPRVVCVKTSCIRPKYDNLREWIEDPDNVYIGRKGFVMIDRKRFFYKGSIWANPFKLSSEIKDTNIENVIDKYRKYILEKLTLGIIKYEELEELRGKNIGCWCKDKGEDAQCHGDVLVEILKNR